MPLLGLPIPSILSIISFLVSWRQRSLAAPPCPEIVLWSPLRDPAASQTSECRELLSRARASFVILAQRQPGKLQRKVMRGRPSLYHPLTLVFYTFSNALDMQESARRKQISTY